MKTRLRLTIDNSLLNSAMAYAASKNISMSELVEEYFKRINLPAKRKTIIELVEHLPMPKINVRGDLKKKYYDDRSGKHGIKR